MCNCSYARTFFISSYANLFIYEQFNKFIKIQQVEKKIFLGGVRVESDYGTTPIVKLDPVEFDFARACFWLFCVFFWAGVEGKKVPFGRKGSFLPKCTFFWSFFASLFLILSCFSRFSYALSLFSLLSLASLRYNKNASNVLRCGLLRNQPSQHLLARGVRALHALSPLTLSHPQFNLNYFLYDKAYRGEQSSPLAGEASSPLSKPLVRVSLRLTHPARVSYTQPGTIYLRYWCWQLGRASPLRRGEIAHTSIILAYTVRCIAVFAYHCIAL